MNAPRGAYVESAMRGTSVLRGLVIVAVLAGGCGAAAAQERAGALPPPWQASVGSYVPSSVPSYATAPPPTVAPAPSYPSWDPDAALVSAAQRATPGPRRVLESVRAMLGEGTVVRGSCYDWVDAVYTRAGGHPHDVFHGSRSHGTYADASQFQPGDWVFFVNHGSGDVTHSAIFLGWDDEPDRIALMVSYAGGRRDEPGRYGSYELTSAYRIVRMTDEPPAPRAAHRGAAHHGRGRRHASRGALRSRRSG